MKVMSFNLRFGSANDGENSWPYRREMVVDLIERYQPDFCGVQEAMQMQMEYLRDQLTGYTSIGVGRDDGGEAGEHSAIFYHSSKFRCLRQKTFWLSETPEIPGSLGWDANNVRICTWGEFQDQASEDSFFVFNTHLDHLGQRARVEGTRLLIQRIEQVAAQQPVILTGDFNCTPDSGPYRILTATETGLCDSRQVAREVSGPAWTFHAFQPPGQLRIDYIFVRNVREVETFASLEDQQQGRYPSDHLPLLVHLHLTEASARQE